MTPESIDSILLYHVGHLVVLLEPPSVLLVAGAGQLLEILAPTFIVLVSFAER